MNTAAPGGHVTSMEEDQFGNTVRELTAANRSLALGLTASDRTKQAELGIAQLPAAERADLLSTATVFDSSGTRALEVFGPLHRIDLSADLKSGSTVLVPAGTSVTARSWTVNEYDAGRPTDGTAKVKDQITKVTTGAQVREHPTVQGETKVTQTVYDWAKGLPTQRIKDPAGLAITEKTEYDAQGRTTKQLLPGASGTDAATRVTTYWSATGTGTCQGRPEWADQVCSTGPGGAITGGGSNPSQLPTTTTEYNWWGTPAKVTETANGTTRTTTTAYDEAGRPTKVTITAGIGQVVPEATTEYDASTGRPVKTTSSTGGTLTRTYDKLGRQISYTDADGGITTTDYDLLGLPVKITDNTPSTTTLTYDHAAEPRGMATATSDSVAGASQVTYDADGLVSTEKLPGGYTLSIGTDPTGATAARTYTRDSDGTTVYTDVVTQTADGQVAAHAGWSDQSYGYDAAAACRGSTTPPTRSAPGGRTASTAGATARRSPARSPPPAPIARQREAPPPHPRTTALTASSTPATRTTTWAAPRSPRAAPPPTTPTISPTSRRPAPSARPGSWTPLCATARGKLKPAAAPAGPRPAPRSTTTAVTATARAGSRRTPPAR